jgi:hypothetical protein
MYNGDERKPKNSACLDMVAGQLVTVLVPDTVSV